MATTSQERRLAATVYQSERTSMPAELPACGSRFILWIDAVGGFLVVEDAAVAIGQAVPGNPVHVPLLADISRHHATIRRDGEGYLIEAIRDVRVDGRVAAPGTWLSDGSLIEVGTAVRLKFRRPHPLSTSARLECASRHQTLPSTSAVLLMSQNLVLGPSPRAHVVCPTWHAEAVLFREREQLFCRAKGKIKVSGTAHVGRAPIDHGSVVEGEGFSFSLEKIG